MIKYSPHILFVSNTQHPRSSAWNPRVTLHSPCTGLWSLKTASSKGTEEAAGSEGRPLPLFPDWLCGPCEVATSVFRPPEAACRGEQHGTGLLGHHPSTLQREPGADSDSPVPPPPVPRRGLSKAQSPWPATVGCCFHGTSVPGWEGQLDVTCTATGGGDDAASLSAPRPRAPPGCP